MRQSWSLIWHDRIVECDKDYKIGWHENRYAFVHDHCTKRIISFSVVRQFQQPKKLLTQIHVELGCLTTGLTGDV